MNSRKIGDKPVRLALIGARLDGQAGVIIDVLSYFENIQIVAFLDHTPELINTEVDGIPVIGSPDKLEDCNLESIDVFHISIGDNKARFDIYKKLKSMEKELLTIIHPTSIISNTARIGEGCFIGAKTVIQNNVTISDVTIINTSSVIEHDNEIGEAVHIAPGANTAGRTKIHDLAFIGVGATIIPDINVGHSAFIGAGAVVTKDVPDNSKMLGYAAKPHHKNIYTDLESD